MLVKLMCSASTQLHVPPGAPGTLLPRLRTRSSQVTDSDYTLATAMGLFDLTDFELFWERAMDTKCLMAWSPKNSVAVLAFRGTASMANVLADLQVGPAPSAALCPTAVHSASHARGSCHPSDKCWQIRP